MSDPSLLRERLEAILEALEVLILIHHEITDTLPPDAGNFDSDPLKNGDAVVGASSL